MKKRKNEILAIVMVTLMLMLVACGNTQEANDTPTNKPNATEASTSTEGITEEPTPEATEEATPEATEELTPEAMEEPSSVPEPTEEQTVAEIPTTKPHTHSYTESVSKKATCTDKGTKTFSCDCGNSYTEAIKATGHNYKVVADSSVLATCSNNGKELDRKCSACGDVIEGAIIPKIAHSYVEYIYNNDATMEKDGTETAICKNCGNKDTRIKAGTRIEKCPYELYSMAYDNQGYPYFYGKWGGSANMDAENYAKTEACIDQMGEYMCEHYTIWREDFDAEGVSFDYSWQLIGRYEGIEIVVRYVESCNNIFLDSPEERGIPTAGNGVWYED